jgi:aspartyl-tRNA(Asn)/glutamyl-tRNA(Gln) amidotransferase subunit A
VIEFLTIAEASRLIETRALSPVDLIQSCLNRIGAVDDRVHAFITVVAERALIEARAAEVAMMRGDWRGPLHGIPYSVKDIIDTAGIRTTGHSRLFADRMPAQDATVVRKMAEAGAVLLGKNATHEFANGHPDASDLFPAARNPWDLARSPGGSSSGSAAAVASGEVLGAIGTDTGGSVRTPAAFCGLAGLKPTDGLVSVAGILPVSKTFDTPGPLARTVEDCAILLSAIAGYDSADPKSAAVGAANYRDKLDRPVRGMKVGVLRRLHEVDAPAEAAVLRALQDAEKEFAAQGVQLVDVALPSLDQIQAAFSLIALAEAFPVHAKDLRECPNLFGRSVRNRLAFGAFIPTSAYLQALELRRQLQTMVLDFMKDVDALLTTTVPDVAPPFSFSKEVRFDTWKKPNTLGLFSFLGWPSLGLCCGFENELPLSMQIVAKPFGEETVLQLGHAYERNTQWGRFRPRLA